MGLDSIRKARDAGRRKARAPQVASALLRVETVDAEAKIITVKLPANTASQLNANADQTVELAIRPNAKYEARQPTMDRLFGIGGGTSMEVAPGSVIIADNVTVADGKASCSWVALGSGPKAEAAGPAVMSEGWLLARTRTTGQGDDRKRRVSCEMLCVDDAREVSPADGRQVLAGAIQAAMEQAGPGRGEAVVRISDPNGSSVHEYVGLWDRDKEAQVTPGEAAEAAGERIQSWLQENEGADPVMEVIPIRKIHIGAETQGAIFEALGKAGPNPNSVNSGARKYRTAEMHPNDRLDTPRNLKVNDPPSEGQQALVQKIAEERGRRVPDGISVSSAAASAWLEENMLRQGWAQGQVLTRTREGDDGSEYEIAIVAALHRRSGVDISAIPTPGNEKAPEFARGQGELAQRQRESLQLSTVPPTVTPAQEEEADQPAPELEEEHDGAPEAPF